MSTIIKFMKYFEDGSKVRYRTSKINYIYPGYKNSSESKSEIESIIYGIESIIYGIWNSIGSKCTIILSNELLELNKN